MKYTYNKNLSGKISATISLSRECTVIMCFVLIFGISTGIFFETLMSADMKANMQNYLQVLFLSLECQPLDLAAITSTLFLNISAILLICISGCTRFCNLTSVIIFSIKGISLGYCCALILETYAFQGLFVILLAILPQNTILLPTLLLGSNVAYNTFSAKQKKGRGYKHITFDPAYFCVFLILVLIISISCIIQLVLFPVVGKLL